MEKEKKMMDPLKKKLFDVLARAITIEEFENWLYANEEINSSIKYNDMVFEIVSINYRKNDAYYKLKEFCNKYYDYEEYLISLVESNCHKLIEARTSEEALPVILHINSFIDWDKDYFLINQFYYLDDELNLAQEGYSKENTVITYINRMALVILNELKDLPMDDKIERLKKGIDINDNKDKVKKNKVVEVNKNFKKWFQFWK